MRLIFAFWWSLALCVIQLGAADQLTGRRAPGFTLPDARGQFHDLGDYRGKVVLLDIMQSGCPNCQTLAQTLEKVKAKYGDKVGVLSVVNPPDNLQTVASFTRKFGVTSPVLLDCGQMAASYLRPNPKRPRIHVPHLFLIDSEGIVRKHFEHTETAIFEGKGLDEEIDQLLK